MKGVNKTLYIPLYGKALVSKLGIIIDDKRSEEIWEKEGFKLKRKAKSKWLAYTMGMRAVVFDNWIKKKMDKYPNAVVLHIGCGLDSRIERIGNNNHQWFDIDFPNVIQERMKYYKEGENYMMFGTDVRETFWISELPKNENAIVIMEGISMYLTENQIKQLFEALGKQYKMVDLIMDCYTKFSAKVSKWKNSINEMGAVTVYGIDEPKIFEKVEGVYFREELDMTPKEMVNELPKKEQGFFKMMFTGKKAKKMYRVFNYELKREIY